MLATLATTHTNSLRGHGESLTNSLLSGYRLAFTLGAILVALAIAAAVTLLRAQAEPSAAVQDDVSGLLGEAEPAYAEEAA